jgi:hypothetical protein
MKLKFVLVKADVSIDWQGDPPNYRIYVGKELFTERTWIWKDEYLEELLQIYAPPGDYDLRWELVPPAQGVIEVTNLRVEKNKSKTSIVDNSQLRIV